MCLKLKDPPKHVLIFQGPGIYVRLLLEHSQHKHTPKTLIQQSALYTLDLKCLKSMDIHVNVYMLGLNSLTDLFQMCS